MATIQSGTTRQGFGDDVLHREDEHDGVGDGVVTLETAVADFDIALRDHRDRRRGLGSKTTTGATVSPGSRHNEGEREPGGVCGREKSGEGADSPLHNMAASNWLDGEATSWATVDLGIDKGLPEEHFCGGERENDVQRDIGSGFNRDVVGIQQTAARVPQTPSSLLGDANVVNGEVEDRNKCAAVDAAGMERIPRPDNPKPFAQDGELISSMATKPPRLPEHIPGDDVIINPAATLSKDLQDSRFSNPPVTTSDSCPAAQKDAGLVEETVNKTTETRLGGATRPSELPPEVSSTDPSPLLPPSAKTSEVVAPCTRGIGSPSQTSCSSAKIPISVVEENITTASPAPPAAAPTFVTPATAANADTTPRDATVAAATAAAVSAPQTAIAMECPDPIATAEQRTAGDWMKGTASTSEPHRLPAPLEVAEAEAELIAKIDRLQSKRLAAEREEREVLDEGRAAKFGQERNARAEGFAEEDKKTLAAQERRLAEIRREADLARRQRSAEFQEIDQKLVGASIAATTGATPMPVRGMRPQHFVEQEDLPAGIKKSLDLPAEKVLDEMEGLAARAKAAGGGMTVEAFERVEQKQRVQQVERMEILHGQTEEEKRVTMLMMAVRLQMFSRQKIARMRIAKLQHARSTSKGRVSLGLSRFG